MTGEFFLRSYTAGIAYFLLIFTLCDVNEEGVIKFISALLIALVVTYRGPPILAKLKITREEMLAKEEAKSRVLATGEPDTAGEGSGTAIYVPMGVLLIGST